MDIFIQSASQYGAMGLMLAACFWYINKKDNEDKDERKNSDLTLEETHRETINVVKANTAAMTELTTIIKNK